MLKKLKPEKLVLDWRTKMQSRAAVQQTIRNAFRTLPANYSIDLQRVKVNLTYAHVFDSYSGSGQSVYAASGV